MILSLIVKYACSAGSAALTTDDSTSTHSEKVYRYSSTVTCTAGSDAVCKFIGPEFCCAHLIYTLDKISINTH